MKKFFLLLTALLAISFISAYEPSQPQIKNLSFEQYLQIKSEVIIISQGDNWILIEMDGDRYIVVI